MADYIEIPMVPLVEKLRARYPYVRIVEASYREHEGIGQQHIRYQAPLPELKRVGLVSKEMWQQYKRRTGRDVTDLGDGFHLCASLDCESMPGCWDLTVWTERCPRERERMSTRDAARVLKRIARSALEAPQ